MNDNKINEDNLRKLIYLRERELGINSELQLMESNMIVSISQIVEKLPAFANGVDLANSSILDNLNIILYNLDRAINTAHEEDKSSLVAGRNVVSSKIDEYKDLLDRVKQRAEIIEKAKGLTNGVLDSKIKRLKNVKEDLAREKNRLKGLTRPEDIAFSNKRIADLEARIAADKDTLEIYRMESSLENLRNSEEARAFMEKYSSLLTDNIDNDIDLFNKEINDLAKEFNIPLLASSGAILQTATEIEDKKDMLAILGSKNLTAEDIKALVSLGMGEKKAIALNEQIAKHQENALAIAYLKQLGSGNNKEIAAKISELEHKQQLLENRLSLELMVYSPNLTMANGKVALANLPRNLQENDYILNALHPVVGDDLKEEKVESLDKPLLDGKSPLQLEEHVLSEEEKEEIEHVNAEIIDDENNIDLAENRNKQLADFLAICAKKYPELFADNNLNLYMDNPTPYDKFMAMYENLQKHLNEKVEYKEVAKYFETLKKYYDKRIKDLQDYKERLGKKVTNLQNELEIAKKENNQAEIENLEKRINAIKDKIEKINEALEKISPRVIYSDEEKKTDKHSNEEIQDVEFNEVKDEKKASDKGEEKNHGGALVPQDTPEKEQDGPEQNHEGPKQIGEGKSDNSEGHDDGDDETIPGDETPEEGKNGPEKDPTPPLLPPHVIKLTDEQKEAYEEIVRQGIGKFSNTEFTEEEVADFVNNHPLISKFAGPDEAQIKENIKNDILKYCKKYEPEIPEDDEEEKKDWKALLGSVAIFTGGFATGLALSCVPGVGTIRMAMATAKLGVSAVNFVSEKLGHGKIINISQKIEQLKNSKFAKKHPKIAAGVDKAYEVLTSKEFNLFVNGVSAGYITGNVIEMVTGKTVLENIKSTLKPEETVIDTPSQNFDQSGISEPSAPETTPQVPADIPVDLTPVQGQTYDLSEIAKGYVASGNKDAVNLITSAGKDAVFDRAVTAGDGQIWYHFKQANGLGYAWFPKDVVEEVIEKSISR